MKADEWGEWEGRNYLPQKLKKAFQLKEDLMQRFVHIKNKPHILTQDHVQKYNPNGIDRIKQKAKHHI